ncbi:MAG: tail fiber domain-containing protein, partial [Bacteroidales bacterium]|nr:tail fiber domain-containing protein [Bacteroidales bacterium]
GTVRFANYPSGANGAIVRSDASGNLAITNFTGNTSDILLGNNTFGTIEDAGGVVSNCGTSNYVPKMASSTELSCSQIYDNGTNVGIGTTSPTAKVEINQNMADYNTSFTGAHLNLGTNNTTDNTGFVGITYDASTSANYGWSSGALRSSGGQSDFVWKHHSNSASGTERMRMTSTGNLGIGTASPGAKLDIYGAGSSSGSRSESTIGSQLYIGQVSYASGYSAYFGKALELGYDTDNDYGFIHAANIYPSSGTGPRALVLQANGGNVGIGTTSPNAKLDIKDHTDTGIMLYLTDDNNSSGELAHKAIQIQTQGTMQSWVATNGDVFYNGSMGIGTESTLSDLDIEQSGGSASNQGTGGINLRNGTYHWRMYNSNNYVRFNYSSDDGVTYTPKAYISPTDGSWNQLSDISLKHNIEELNPVINQIKQIKVIQYNYIDNPDGCSKVLGVSANDVQKIFPQIVSSENDDGIVGIDYSKFGVISIKAIQEQQQIIEQQQQQIDLL